MEDDTEQSVVKKESVENDDGERVVKLSLGKLIKSSEHIDKPLLIGVIEQYVLRNSELFTRLGIIMHLIIMRCVEENRSLPPKFCDDEFIAQAANWAGWRNQLHPLIVWAVGQYGPLLLPDVPVGKSWLLGYIVTMFRGNTITSIKGKWSALIKDSINGFARVVLQEDTTLSDQQIDRIKREIHRQILSPASQRPDTAPLLQPNALELVRFHRQGFRCVGENPLTKFYIATNKGHYHHFVLHFGHCLRRQEDMENEWNANHLPTDRIGLTKRTPLPFYNSGTRKSVQIDQKGLYYILRSYVQAGGDLIHNGAPWFPNGYNSFQPYYQQWVRYIFDIDAVIDGRKRFKLDKVGITTSGVRASVHYRNMPRRNVPNNPDHDNESLAQSIAYLSLNHHGDDDTELGNDFVNIGIDNEDDYTIMSWTISLMILMLMLMIQLLPVLLTTMRIMSLGENPCLITS